ncbi:unnamed protein product, partial [Coregonus sp. 'balchen']
KVEREPKGKFSVPILDVKSRHLVLEANQTLTIHCRGRWELSWVFPGGVARDKESVQLEDSRCGRQSQHYCSQLILSSAQAQHTGSFRCRYSHRTRRQSAVYFPDRELTPDQRNIVWNSRQGFLIRMNKIMDVYLNSTSPVQALQGESLAINCTVTAEWNSRVSISWDYPGQANRAAIISRRIMASKTHMVFYSILSIPQLHRSDRGLYICRVTSGPVSRETNVSVTVYGQKSYRLSPKLRAFPAPVIIWLKDGKVAAEQCSRYHVDENSLVIRDVAEEDAGKYTILVGIQEHGLYQNLTLSLVVNVSRGAADKPCTAPPTESPLLTSPGSGTPAPPKASLAEHGPDAAPEEAQGQWARLGQADRDLGPQGRSWILGPVLGPGNRSALIWPGQEARRVSCAKIRALFLSLFGFLPDARRFPAACVRPPSSSLWSPQHVHTQPHHTHRQEVLQGKNKTVGILMVAEAFVSGVYHWIASNSTSQEASVCQEEEPSEGGDLHLTCIANKHLYTKLSWQLVTDTAEATPPNPSLGGELSSGEFSDTLCLLLSNLTAGDSGTYYCFAHHLLKGQNTHLDTQVDITDSSAVTESVSSSVTLSCPAHGVPHPLITWYKDQHPLLHGSGIVIAPGGGTLHIDRITVEEQGLYTCQSTNERGLCCGLRLHLEGLSLEISTLTCTCLLLTLFIHKLKQYHINQFLSGKAEYLSIILDQEEGPLEEQCDRLQYDPGQWEFPRDRLKLEKPLGREAFGKVMQVSAFGIDNSTGCRTVAVKMLNEGATPSEHKALMTELTILNHISHHLNVVNLLGACIKAGPLMVIVECCRHGNLPTYLKSKRDMFLLNSVSSDRQAGRQAGSQAGVSKSPLLLEDLISYRFQVARGMEFLYS